MQFIYLDELYRYLQVNIPVLVGIEAVIYLKRLFKDLCISDFDDGIRNIRIMSFLVNTVHCVVVNKYVVKTGIGRYTKI